jgi:tryptophan 2,3-dioxygenase
LYYSDYLQLDKILNAQSPESEKKEQPAHDEMLFIVIHQAYELWFKQLMFELESVTSIMDKPALNDNSPELQTVVHRLSRVVSILKLLVHQIDIMETMTAMDFLDFRDMLRPASGFQSWQFKILEARLGLKYENRHAQEYYISQLRPEHVDQIKNAEKERSLLQLVNDWLERMPYMQLRASSQPPPMGEELSNSKLSSEETNLKKEVGATSPPLGEAGWGPSSGWPEAGAFWISYRQIYSLGLAEPEQNNLQLFDSVFYDQPPISGRQLSAKASRAALFIMLYRGYPILQLPFQLLNNLLEIDEQLSTWRYRHMSMVHRMIGSRIGTGGSTGRDYLKGALDKHYIFAEIARLTSFLIERRKLPVLSAEIERNLGFTHQ